MNPDPSLMGGMKADYTDNMIFLLIIFNQKIDFESLYDSATTALVKFQAVKDSAVQKFIELGSNSAQAKATVIFLVSKFDTKSAMESQTLENILKKLGKPAIDGIVVNLGFRGSDEESRSLKMSLRILGEIGGEDIVEPASRFTGDFDWRVRSGAYTALGKSKSLKAKSYIIQGLQDSIYIVRKSAYYALSQVATEGEIPYLIAGLNDEFYGVRYAAVAGLKKVGKPAMKFLLGALNLNNDEIKNYFIIQALKEIGASKKLKKLIRFASPTMRLSIYQGIDDKDVLERWLKSEEYPLLETFIKTKIRD